MSLNCIDNIVVLDNSCGVTPLSGLYLIDAPEISTLNLARTATEKDISGKALANRILTNAGVMVRNDMLSVLAANQMLLDVTDKKHETTKFTPTTTISAAAKERGLVLYKKDQYGFRNSIKKTVITKIQIYSLTTVNDVPVYIHDTGLKEAITSTYSIDLVADEITEVTVNYEVLGAQATVSMDCTNVATASGYLTCFVGCNGTAPNDCGYTKGYNNGSIGGKESYGIGIEFRCECDYDRILCNLAKTSLGKIIWQKARIMLMQEHLSSNRLNDWIIYNREEIKDYHLPKLEQEYNTDWSVFVKSLPALLKQYNGDCIVCNGIRTVIHL